jgi:hypothetical protein
MTTREHRPFRPRLAARLTGAAALALFASAQAFAQRGVGPPRPQAPEEPPVFLFYGVLLLLALLTIGASIIPSKRGHLD